MSLFGSSPEEPSPIKSSTIEPRNTLFDDDESAVPTSKSTLFADDDTPGWGLPTPKKAARGELIRSLLDGADIPDSYIDIFDSLLKSDKLSSGGKVSPAGITSTLSAGKLGADSQSRIMTLVASGGQLSDLNRNEFNVLLALIGLAQENEDISLDGVDERRRSQCLHQCNLSLELLLIRLVDLPVPKLLTAATFPNASELAAKPPQQSASPSATDSMKPRTPRKPSMDFPEVDPWASPALHKGHNHEQAPSNMNAVPSATSNGTHGPTRTTSNFTTTSQTSPNGASHQVSQDAPSTPAVGGWEYDGAGPSTAAFGSTTDNSIEDDGFGGPAGGGDHQNQNIPTRSFGGGRVSGSGVEETILVTLLPEKEGMFMFQHHNYQVASPRRGSKVVRRYSDFVWLLDCLHKRYPFRQLPLLPPKRVGGKSISSHRNFGVHIYPSWM
jgi:sorting nexin-8